MLYEIRRYALSPSGAGQFQSAFEAELVPVLREHGFDLLGVWTVEIGAGPALVWMLRWPDLGRRDACYSAVRADPRNQRFRAENLEHLTGVESTILSPTAISPLE